MKKVIVKKKESLPVRVIDDTDENTDWIKNVGKKVGKKK